MPHVDSHAPGKPSWVDLGSPDLEASVAFYDGLFGWTATEPGPVEETGGYVPVPPTDIPPGRFAVLNDPQGAHFSVIKVAAPPT